MIIPEVQPVFDTHPEDNEILMASLMNRIVEKSRDPASSDLSDEEIKASAIVGQFWRSRERLYHTNRVAQRIAKLGRNGEA